MFSNGDKYIGEFRAGRRNGQGAYTFSNGTRQVGEFRDGKFVEPSPRLEVALHSANGVLLVPVLINNKIPLDFILDSGAADVSVPADVVLTLMRTGTLTEADFTGTTTYILADGSTVPSQTFRIRSLKVGDKVLENVSGSVASVNGSLLLGQSFLKRFKSWSIDNERQVLMLR
jgi:predicted aspartyl protease